MQASRISGCVAVLLAATSCAVPATDYYAAYGAPSTGDCTNAAAPCDLGYAMGIASGSDIRIHVGPSAPAVYAPQYIDGTKSMTLIGNGSGDTWIGSASSVPKCDFTVTTATLVLEDLMLRNGTGCCGRGVCVNVPDGAAAGVTLRRVVVQTGTDGGRGIDATTGGTGTVAIDVADTLVQANGDGGIVVSGKGTVTIARSLFTHDYNNSLYSTAPLQIAGAVTTTVRNATFSGNFVNGSVSGIAHDSTGLLTLSNVTFAGNADFAISANVASITHSIIAGTCSIGFTIVGDSSIESPGATCGLATPSSQVNVSAAALNLGPLADNGGLTQTLLPQSGSVAVGVGGSGCEPVDQRNFPRTGACDAGAVQEGIFASGFE